MKAVAGYQVADQVAGLAAGLAVEVVAEVVAEMDVVGDWNKESDVVGIAVAAGEKGIACLLVETAARANDRAPGLQPRRFLRKTSYVAAAAQVAETVLKEIEVAVAPAD